METCIGSIPSDLRAGKEQAQSTNSQGLSKLGEFFFQSVLWLENADVSNLKYLTRKKALSVNFSSEEKAR